MTSLAHHKSLIGHLFVWQHPPQLRRILERLIAELADVAIAETMPRQEGNQMHVILSQRTGRKTNPKRSQDTAAEPAATTEE